MRDLNGLMNEFAAALQFFDGFGENWLGLLDCLQYLDEWMPADTYMLVIERAEEVLANESPDQTTALLQTLDDAGKWWSQSIENNGRFNRGPIPFHSILNVSSGGQSTINRLLESATSAKIEVRQ